MNLYFFPLIQGCNFNEIVNDDFILQVNKLDVNNKVRIIDFRRTVIDSQDLSKGIKSELGEDNNFLLFDLGKESLLEDISTCNAGFRVTMYDPRKMAKTQRSGKHQYLIAKEVIEADVVINIPKLKTHRKAGYTGALKNLVGINGNKDFLPHHRVGGTYIGGDAYYGFEPVKRIAEFFLDKANHNIGNKKYNKWSKLAYKTLNLYNNKKGDSQIEGNWWGNDTIWRTILDLNRILLYGKADGTMSDDQQRSVLSLTDAIVCGENEGPLSPDPVFLGAITFSNSAVIADLINVALFRFDKNKIPVLKNATNNFRFPLVKSDFEYDSIRVKYHNSFLYLNEISQIIGKNVKPTYGWIRHIESV